MPFFSTEIRFGTKIEFHVCYSLLEQGPCQEGEWLIIDQDVATCKTIPCDSKMDENGRWNMVQMDDGNCVTLGEPLENPCALGMDVFGPNIFGKGEQNGIFKKTSFGPNILGSRGLQRAPFTIVY